MRRGFSVRSKRISYFVWVQAFIIAAAILFCLAAASITALKLDERRKRPPEDEDFSVLRQIQYSSRQIRYSFTLQNQSNRMLEQAELWTFAPVKQTASQRRLHLQSNYPYQLLADGNGNEVLHFKFEDLAPYGVRVVTIKADLLVSPTAVPSPAGLSQRNLDPQKYIESDHPAVTHVARKLRASSMSETVENIFRWVTTNIRYSGYAGNDRGALYALRHKKGDCTEYTDLFVALCRAAGIAARPVGGYVCPQNAVLKARDYHNWGEFYENGIWKVADPQKHMLKRHAANYIAMRIIPASQNGLMGSYNRFRFRGEGLKVRMN